MNKAGIAPVLTLLASVFSAQAAGGALPNDEVGQPGGWRNVARPLVSSLRTLASEFSRSVLKEALKEARRARLKADAQALLFASAQRPIVAVLDTNHKFGLARSFLNNPYLVSGWKAQGKKAVFLELWPSKQPIFDRFYKGQTSKDDFKKEIAGAGISIWLQSPLREHVLSDFVEGVALLKSAGIRVHCVDPPFVIRTGSKEHRAITMGIMFEQENTSQKDRRDILNMAFPGGKEEFTHVMKGIGKRRDVQNPEIAAAIKMRLHKGDGAVIVYGSGHFDGARDLNEMIGKEKVVTIALFKNRENYIKADLGKDPPHYVYTNDDGTFFRDFEGRRAGLPEPQQPDTHQPENPASPVLMSALRAPASER